MFGEGIALRNLERGPEPIVGARRRRIRGARDDVSAERIFLKKEIKRGLGTFRRNLPGTEGSVGQAGGKERLADAPNDPAGQKRPKSFDDQI